MKGETPMADTRAKAVKAKIVPGTDLGNPKAVTLLPENERRMMMGTVMGYVDKIITRTMPNGEVYEGFSGYFEAIPSNPELPVVQSGVCYFPSGFHNLIAEPLKDAQKTDENARIDFVFEVSAVKSNNPQGYSWEYTPKIASKSSDPLAHLRASTTEALTDQSHEKTKGGRGK